jgi:hypothetical protein
MTEGLRSLERPPHNLPLKQPEPETIRYQGSLSDRAAEIAILAAAYHDSEFEWRTHASIAGRLGLGETEVNTLRSGSDLALSDVQEKAAVEAARARRSHRR